MANFLSFGQHPAGAMPLFSFPAAGRVGIAILIIAAAKSKYHLVGEDFDLQAALKEDKELIEILTIILQTGLFD